MNNNDNIIELKSPEESAPDLLTELLRKGAKELIRQAVNAELEELLGEYSEQKVDGKQAVIRNGFFTRANDTDRVRGYRCSGSKNQR